MTACPHCDIEVRVNELPHQGLFKSFRICPACGGKFSVDNDTKIRQAILIPILVITLVLTILLYYGGQEWLLPAIVCYSLLGVLIYRGNKKVFLVPYPKEQDSADEI